MYRSFVVLVLVSIVLCIRLNTHQNIYDFTSYSGQPSHYQSNTTTTPPSCKWNEKDIQASKSMTISLSDIYSLGRLPGQCNPKNISEQEKTKFLKNRDLVKNKILSTKTALLGSSDEKKKEAGRRLEEYEKSYDECVRVLTEGNVGKEKTEAFVEPVVAAPVEVRKVETKEQKPVKVGQTVKEEEVKRKSQKELKQDLEELNEEKMIKQKEQQQKILREKRDVQKLAQQKQENERKQRIAEEQKSRLAIEKVQKQKVALQQQAEIVEKQKLEKQKVQQQQRAEQQRIQKEKIERQRQQQERITAQRLQQQEQSRKKTQQEQLRQSQQLQKLTLQQSLQQTLSRQKQLQSTLKGIQSQQQRQSSIRAANRKQIQLLRQRIFDLQRIEQERRQKKLTNERLREARLREQDRAEVQDRLLRQERKNREFLRLIGNQKDEQARLLREQANELRQRSGRVEVKSVNVAPMSVPTQRQNVVEVSRKSQEVSEKNIQNKEKSAVEVKSVNITPTPATPYSYTNPLSPNLLLADPSKLSPSLSLPSPSLRHLYCPSSTPYFNNHTCITCPSLFNLNTLSCTTCPHSTLYSPLHLSCLPILYTTNLNAPNIQLQQGTISEWRAFEEILRKAAKGVVKECELKEPFLIDGKCGNCGEDMPLYDLMAERCGKCLDEFRYDGESRKCVVKEKEK